jgi:hypothetical protein
VRRVFTTSQRPRAFILDEAMDVRFARVDLLCETVIRRGPAAFRFPHLGVAILATIELAQPRDIEGFFDGLSAGGATSRHWFYRR